jgi:hypothetical protein
MQSRDAADPRSFSSEMLRATRQNSTGTGPMRRPKKSFSSLEKMSTARPE